MYIYILTFLQIIIDQAYVIVHIKCVSSAYFYDDCRLVCGYSPKEREVIPLMKCYRSRREPSI